MSQTQLLYQLQQIDLELETRRSRVREIKTALEPHETLEQARTQLTNLQNELSPQEKRAKDLTLEIQSVTTQSNQFSDRLYSGSGGNPKELQDLQDKIAELKRRRAVLEDRLLETMIAVETLQGDLLTTTQQVTTLESEWAIEQKALKEEGRQLTQEIKTLKTDREAVAERLSASNRELYDTLRAAKQGVAVVTLHGDTCTGCFVSQTTTLVQRVRQEQELVFCASCGRILIAD